MTFSARRFARRPLDSSVVRARDLIGQLGTAIGIPELHLEDGSCTLSVDGLVVTLELDAPHNRLVVSSCIGDVDDSDGGRRYRSVLEGSLDGIVDGTGMVFAVDAAQSRIVMATALFLDDLDGSDIADALSDFVTRAEAWRSRVSGPAEAPDSAAAAHVVPGALA